MLGVGGCRIEVESKFMSKERAVDAWREELLWEVWICVRSAPEISCHWKHEFGHEKRLGIELSLRKSLCGVGTSSIDGRRLSLEES